MTRLSMIVDTINQDLIIPNVEKVAKLCADFKSGVETIFVNHENQQEVIEIDDFTRQGEYKYMYADSSMTTQKSEQADLVVQAIEKFASLIPLNLQEIFVWYFEQKGVDNPERFLGGIGVNEDNNGNSLPLQAVTNEAANAVTKNLNPMQNENEVIKELIPMILELGTKNNKKDGLSELIAAMKQKRKSNEIKKLHKQA